MLVAFKARAVFTDSVTYSFASKVNKATEPFHSLCATGGLKNWYFTGILFMRTLKQNKRIAYEITSALVKKVEALTLVGINTIDFDEIDAQVMVDPKPVTHDNEEQ